MLKLSGTVAAGSLLAACAPAVPQVVKETVVVPQTVPPVTVKETVIVQQTVPAAPAATGAPAPAATPAPVTLTLYNPTGAAEVTQLFAPRIDTLAGKTICEVSNDAWESNRTFPLIRELLQKMYPTAKFIPYTEFSPTITGATGSPTYGGIDDDKTAAFVKAKGCQAVIVGNAG
jgi:hypothetical protein